MQKLLQKRRIQKKYNCLNQVVIRSRVWFTNLRSGGCILNIPTADMLKSKLLELEHRQYNVNHRCRNRRHKDSFRNNKPCRRNGSISTGTVTDTPSGMRFATSPSLWLFIPIPNPETRQGLDCEPAVATCVPLLLLFGGYAHELP